MRNQLRSSEQREKKSYSVFDMKYLWTIFATHKKWFALSVVLCLFLAVAYVYFTRPAYNIVGKMMLIDRRQSNSSSLSSANAALLSQLPSSLSSSLNLGRSLGSESEKEILKTKLLAKDVVEDLGLFTEIRLQKNLKSRLLYKNTPVNVTVSKECLHAMNEGLKVARGRYLAIMNSDCTLESDIDGMIRFMEDHPAIGAIAPQMRDAEGNIQDTARHYVSVPRYVWRQTKRIVRHKISVLDTQMDYSLTQTTDWVIGAFIMVSRKAYELTGGLDNRFFMYAEDLDWCTRIRQQGLEVVYYPQVLITYKGTRRARSNSKYAKIFISSHIKYWKKFGFFYGYPPRKKCIYTV